mgnify:CR=1 FL=1
MAQAEFRERQDLQALLRKQLPDLIPELLVIAEEFGDWDESRRRIDLLAVDRKANLVVIELKRGDTGSHMELQALRYAAMVSTMTFEQAVTAYEKFLGKEQGLPARQRLLDFLGWSEPNEDDFAQDVRLILFSEDFSRELTTSILWLNQRQLDISCYRMSAYKLDERLLLDFQQIIPLREAEEYQVKLRNKQQEEQAARRDQVPWNGELYANYGDSDYRSWDDARKYGFISAGGSDWFSRTLRLLEPGRRVWVNRPGAGYIGVGIVTGEPVDAREFKVDTPDGQKLYLDVGQVNPAMRAAAEDSESAEKFVPIRWIKTVDESDAIRESGLFGNQNSAAKPVAASWPLTVARLTRAFGLAEEDNGNLSPKAKAKSDGSRP